MRIWTIALTLVFGVPAWVSAQDNEAPGLSPEDPEAAQHARERFQAGMEHFQAHHYRDAVHEFELAASLVPSADIWFNIARAYEELQEFEPAIDYYRRYLRDRVDPPDRQRVETHITRLEARMEAARQENRHAPTTGTLRIRASIDGARVNMDGREVGESPLPAPLTVEPGEHELTVEQDGYIPFRSRVSVQPGVDTTAYADLREATEYRGVRGSRIFTWIAGGLSVVAFGSAIGIAVVAEGTKNDWAAEPGMPPDSPTLRDARDLALISDVMFGVGIGMAVVAVVLYFIEGRAVGTERVSGTDVAVLSF